MDGLRSRFLERAGEAAASDLSFAEEGPPLGPENAFRIACGPEAVRLDGRGALAEFVFGPAGYAGTLRCGPDLPAGPGSGRLAAVFPVPAPQYGLNFV